MAHTVNLAWDNPTPPPANTTGFRLALKSGGAVVGTQDLGWNFATATLLNVAAGSYSVTIAAINNSPDSTHPVLSPESAPVAFTVTDPNPTPATPTGLKVVSIA